MLSLKLYLHNGTVEIICTFHNVILKREELTENCIVMFLQNNNDDKKLFLIF